RRRARTPQRTRSTRAADSRLSEDLARREAGGQPVYEGVYGGVGGRHLHAGGGGGDLSRRGRALAGRGIGEPGLSPGDLRIRRVDVLAKPSDCARGRVGWHAPPSPFPGPGRRGKRDIGAALDATGCTPLVT